MRGQGSRGDGGERAELAPLVVAARSTDDLDLERGPGLVEEGGGREHRRGRAATVVIGAARCPAFQKRTTPDLFSPASLT